MKNIIEVVVCFLLVFFLIACSAPFGKTNEPPAQVTEVEVSPENSIEQTGNSHITIHTKEDFFALVNPYFAQKGYITFTSEKHFIGHYVDDKITENTYTMYDDVSIVFDEDDNTGELKSIKIYAPIADKSKQALEFFSFAKEITISALDANKAKLISEELNISNISEEAFNVANGDYFSYHYIVNSSTRWLQVDIA